MRSYGDIFHIQDITSANFVVHSNSILFSVLQHTNVGNSSINLTCLFIHCFYISYQFLFWNSCQKHAFEDFNDGKKWILCYWHVWDSYRHDHHCGGDGFGEKDQILIESCGFCSWEDKPFPGQLLVSYGDSGPVFFIDDLFALWRDRFDGGNCIDGVGVRGCDIVGTDVVLEDSAGKLIKKGIRFILF